MGGSHHSVLDTPTAGLVEARVTVMAAMWMDSLNLVPRDGASGRDVFTKLATNFGLSDAVRDALIATKMDNLDEFRFFFDEEAKVDAWVNRLSLGEEKALQAARVRRAWFAVRLLFRNMETDRSKVAASDLDSMLAESELRDTKVAFWRRYHQRYPAEVHPSDATLSRVTREISKRMLCVYNVWKVKSLQFQLHTTNRKRKLGENLYTEEQEVEDDVSQDWETYLDKLHTLLLAYAMAGAAPAPSPPGHEEGLGADSTKYVDVPLDVVMAYFYRAKRTISQLPHTKRLAWLQNRDAEERAEWVSKFRESQDSLGQVIKDTMVARDAHWIPAIAASIPVGTSGTSVSDVKTPAMSNHFALGKPIQGRSVAKVLKDGSKLCQSFQHGQCKNKVPCAMGQHRCGLVIKKERVCGAGGHGAASCKQTPKLG